MEKKIWTRTVWDKIAPFLVRKLSVIDMEFSDFFDMLWTYLGDPDESKDNKGRPKFFCHLIDLIIRTPQTDVEDKKSRIKAIRRRK